ncbi:hypothetical protein [Mycolicibacterium brumae]|nr:hypothetical protein [Mycolicibacterium brumae]MCV7193721.1 hypothetical protein [Mycolicibacterium brumae]UWW09008.1 hypothetical protein L2Z93_002089 [Mycolicibacterium brumae]
MIAVAIAVSGCGSTPTIAADPAPRQFPDLDGFQRVNAGPYGDIGGHPSASGWRFSTPSGVRCVVTMIPTDGGISCQGTQADGRLFRAHASTSQAAEFSATDES